MSLAEDTHQAPVEIFVQALRSIANSACCVGCQEAAQVSKKALHDGGIMACPTTQFSDSEQTTVGVESDSPEKSRLALELKRRLRVLETRRHDIQQKQAAIVQLLRALED